MNTVRIGKFVAVALFLGGVSARGETASLVATKEGVPGGVSINAVKVTAKVIAVNAKSRKVTIQRPDGEKRTFKAGPEIVNFDQIQVGDEVSLTVAEALVVFMSKAGEPAAAQDAAAMALAPEGAKPGMMVAGSVELKAKVTAIDLEGHKATLAFAEGESQTVAVRPDVDLTKVKIGDSVTIRMTEALAIRVEKP